MERLYADERIRAADFGRDTRGQDKGMTLRRHGNLTTYEGLKEYRRIVAEERGCSEEETDVIRYDYQLMDDVKWILATGGYKIIEKAM